MVLIKEKSFTPVPNHEKATVDFFSGPKAMTASFNHTTTYLHHTGGGLGYLPPVKKPRNTTCSSTKSTSSMGTTGKRKCSVCRQEGERIQWQRKLLKVRGGTLLNSNDF